VPVIVNRSSRISLGAFFLARTECPGNRDDSLSSGPSPFGDMPQMWIEPLMLQPCTVISCGASHRGAPVAESRNFLDWISILGLRKAGLSGPLFIVAPLQSIFTPVAALPWRTSRLVTTSSRFSSRLQSTATCQAPVLAGLRISLIFSGEHRVLAAAEMPGLKIRALIAVTMKADGYQMATLACAWPAVFRGDGSRRCLFCRGCTRDMVWRE